MKHVRCKIKLGKRAGMGRLEEGREKEEGRDEEEAHKAYG
jgi:hypothetical protein